MVIDDGPRLRAPGSSELLLSGLPALPHGYEEEALDRSRPHKTDDTAPDASPPASFHAWRRESLPPRLHSQSTKARTGMSL
jgi:hypothetical protein